MIRELEQAFRQPAVILDESGASDLKRAIHRLECESIRRYLPGLLATVTQKESWDDDLLIYSLDGFKTSETDVAVREQLIAFAADAFGCFSLSETEAISNWLDYVSGHASLELCRDDFESAVKFWTTKTEVLGK
jgi:hypothetical protein